MKDPKDPRIAFYKNIKAVENDLRKQNPTITLNFIIISNARLPEIGLWDGGMTKVQFEEGHVLFQQEDRDTYIEKLLAKAAINQIGD